MAAVHGGQASAPQGRLWPGMDRSQTMQVLEGSGWISQTKSYSRGTRRAARSGGWRPCTVTKANHALAGGELSSACSHAQSLHTVAPDVRLRAQGGPPRPLSRSNTKADNNHSLRVDRQYWDEGLWKWLPARPVASGSSGENTAEESVARWVSEVELGVRSTVDRTEEERNLDSLRSSLCQLQDDLGSDMLHQALQRMRRKLISKFAAMQSFHQMDIDCSGYLDLREFSFALRQLGVKLGQAQMELVFCAIDKDGSGEIECEEFLETVFDPGWRPAEGSGDGLAKWSTWTRRSRGPNDSDLDNSRTVLQQLHEPSKRPAGAVAWPASILQPVGWRSDAAVARRQREAMSRSLPDINPAEHPSAFFRRGGEGAIGNVLQSWNAEWRKRDSSQRKKPGHKQRQAAQLQRNICSFESIAGLQSDAALQSPDLWMSPKSLRKRDLAQLQRVVQRLAHAQNKLRTAESDLEIHASMPMNEQARMANYFDVRTELSTQLETYQEECDALTSEVAAVEAQIGYDREQAAAELDIIEAKRAKLAAMEAKLSAAQKKAQK